MASTLGLLAQGVTFDRRKLLLCRALQKL